MESESKDGYYALASAIVLSAVKDYERALKRLKKKPWDDRATYVKTDCERFFKSGWIWEICDLNGNEIMRKIRIKCAWDRKED